MKTVGQIAQDNPIIKTELFKNVALPSGTESGILWQYFYMRNKHKYFIPDYTIDDLNIAIITTTLVYKSQLDKYWATVDITYPLIENYNMDETVTTINTPDIKTTQTSNRTQTQTGTGETSAINNIVSISENNNTNAVTTFENTTNFSDTENTVASATNNSDNNSTSSTETEITTTDSDTTNITKNGTDTTTVTTNRHGNIGVTTNQQMLQQERELLTFNFINYYMELIEKHILLHIYE